MKRACMAGRSGYPKISGRVFRISGISGSQKYYPKLVREKKNPKIRVPENSGSGSGLPEQPEPEPPRAIRHRSSTSPRKGLPGGAAEARDLVRRDGSPAPMPSSHTRALCVLGWKLVEEVAAGSREDEWTTQRRSRSPWEDGLRTWLATPRRLCSSRPALLPRAAGLRSRLAASDRRKTIRHGAALIWQMRD